MPSMSRSGWLHCHPIRHFWLQLELHLKLAASTRIFTAVSAILQVTPATQPASHILPIASHCICRSALTALLTLSVAGARYLAISAPRSDRGSALEPDRDHSSNQVRLVLAAIIDGQPASNGGTL